MTLLRCDNGSVFSPDEVAFYSERCPICSAEMGEFRETDSVQPSRGLFRICMANPARKNVAPSHMAKAHYHETIGENYYNSPWSKNKPPLYNHWIYVRQAETHPSKYLAAIHFQGHERKTTTVYLKNTSAPMVVPGWWKPGHLSVENYKDVYTRAQRLLNFT